MNYQLYLKDKNKEKEAGINPFFLKKAKTKDNTGGGSPGLVVMGDDSCLEGCWFESQCRILDGHFFTLMCCKNCIFCLKRLKINEKEAGVGPFYKKSWEGKIASCATKILNLNWSAGLVGR